MDTPNGHQRPYFPENDAFLILMDTQDLICCFSCKLHDFFANSGRGVRKNFKKANCSHIRSAVSVPRYGLARLAFVLCPRIISARCVRSALRVSRACSSMLGPSALLACVLAEPSRLTRTSVRVPNAHEFNVHKRSALQRKPAKQKRTDYRSSHFVQVNIFKEVYICKFRIRR